MLSYSEARVFTPDEVKQRDRAAQIVQWLPNHEGLRCHEVARIVGAILGLTVVDGHFGRVNHSWLVTPRPGRVLHPNVILDTYAVGCVPQVILVDANSGPLPFRLAYRPGKARDDVEEALVADLVAAWRKVAPW